MIKHRLQQSQITKNKSVDEQPPHATGQSNSPLGSPDHGAVINPPDNDTTAHGNPTPEFTTKEMKPGHKAVKQLYDQFNTLYQQENYSAAKALYDEQAPQLTETYLKHDDSYIQELLSRMTQKLNKDPLNPEKRRQPKNLSHTSM